MPVRHQVQGHGECVPTSIAILLGISKDDVIATAKPSHLNAWSEILAVENYELYWEIVPMLLDAAFGPAVAWQYINRAGRVFRPKRCPTGRGLITITFNNRRIGHMVAFASDMIYDPMLPWPVKWDSWRRYYENRNMSFTVGNVIHVF